MRPVLLQSSFIEPFFSIIHSNQQGKLERGRKIGDLVSVAVLGPKSPFRKAKARLLKMCQRPVQSQVCWIDCLTLLNLAGSRSREDISTLLLIMMTSPFGNTEASSRIESQQLGMVLLKLLERKNVSIKGKTMNQLGEHKWIYHCRQGTDYLNFWGDVGYHGLGSCFFCSSSSVAFCTAASTSSWKLLKSLYSSVNTGWGDVISKGSLVESLTFFFGWAFGVSF